MPRILGAFFLAGFVLVAYGLYAFLKPSPSVPKTEPPALVTANATTSMRLTLSSPAFENDGTIPAKYTCDGDNVSPPLVISGVPEGTRSLVLVMDDPDIPSEVKQSRGIDKFNHWAVYNIPADTTEIKEGALFGTVAVNSAGNSAYTGPCPPTQYQPTEHRYVFRLYATKGTLNFIKAPTLDEVETAAKGDMLESADLVGRYDRSK